MIRQCISVSGLWAFALAIVRSGGSLPSSWRWYKLRKQLHSVGLARGEALAEAKADYLIDNGLATGRRP